MANKPSNMQHLALKRFDKFTSVILMFCSLSKDTSRLSNEIIPD